MAERLTTRQGRGSASAALLLWLCLVASACVAVADDAEPVPTASTSIANSSVETTGAPPVGQTEQPSESGQPTPDLAPPRSCSTWFADGHFAISGYSVPKSTFDEPSRSIAELAAAGYTHVGPFYDEAPFDELREAAAADICVVHHIGVPGIAGVDAERDGDNWTMRASAQVAAVVADSEMNDLVSMWMVLPEELNLNSGSQREFLEQITLAIREADPLDRPVGMFQTSNADEIGFESASEILDAVVQGQYLVNDGDERRRAILAFRIERARQFADAPESRATLVLPAIEHGNSDRDIDPADEPLIEPWVRHDILTTLGAGADGFFAFSHFPRGRPSAFAAYNDAFVDVVGEMTRSGVLASPVRRTELDAEVIQGPAEVEVVEINSGGDLPAIQASTLAVVLDGGENLRWLVLVNHTDEIVSLRLDNLEGTFVSENGTQFGADGSRAVVDLGPFEAVLARSAD